MSRPLWVDAKYEWSDVDRAIDKIWYEHIEHLPREEKERIVAEQVNRACKIESNES